MTMSPHISLITLGVADVQAAAAFYERLGLKRSAMSQDAVVFFDLGGTALHSHHLEIGQNDYDDARRNKLTFRILKR